MSPALGIALAGLLSLVARHARWLTPEGALAATGVGGAVFAGAGLPGAALLTVFFVTGSLLTYEAGRPGARHAEPGGGRTGRQVLANGAWAAGGGVLHGFGVDLGWPLLAGALAAAQADTWATEIGLLSRHRPRLINSGRAVPPGTSGAVTLLGTGAGVAGAAVIAGIAWATGPEPRVAAAALAAGSAAMLLDSLLGATVQAAYRCERCATETEAAVHHCGQPARRVRGAPWLNNDVVNFLATGAGGVAAGVLS